MQINDPAVVAEVAALFAAYQRALTDNDVAALAGFFWDSPHALRFGVAEELYGADEIESFRKARTTGFSGRTTLRETLVTLGPDMAVATLEFSVSAGGDEKRGRQSQVWVRLPDLGWRIVSAHVSYRAAAPAAPATAFAAAAPTFMGQPVDPTYRDGVATNLAILARFAGPLMAFDLPDDLAPAPRFTP